jgi:hypothetical protein
VRNPNPRRAPRQVFRGELRIDATRWQTNEDQNTKNFDVFSDSSFFGLVDELIRPLNSLPLFDLTFHSLRSFPAGFLIGENSSRGDYQEKLRSILSSTLSEMTDIGIASH